MRISNVFKLCITAVAVSLLAACSWGTPSPSPTPSSSSTSPTPTPLYSDRILYFTSDTALGFKIFPETHEVLDSVDPVTDALTALVVADVAPNDPDYFNLWAGDNTLNSAVVDGGDLTVDLHLTGLNVGSSGEQSAIDQLMFTAVAADDSVTRVKFLVDGKSVESLAGHVDTSSWIDVPDAFAAVSAVNIDVPVENSTFGPEVTFSGMACTFEANVAWKLSKAGKLVKQGSTLAGEACPTRSPWQVSFKGLAAGEYTFAVMEYSAKDGSLSAMDDRDFTVSP